MASAGRRPAISPSDSPTPATPRILLVTLPEATPVHEAAALQADLARAGIKPYAWVVNQSLAAAAPTDPLLAARAGSEGRYLTEVATRHADRTAVLAWSPAPPVGAEALAQLAAPPVDVPDRGDQGTTKEPTVAELPEVLFVCVHNAGRSQMAAALLHHHGAGTVRVTSAGSAPAAQINPAVREVMNEIGIDLSHEFPKRLTTDAVESADVVITMGCGDACPVFPGKRYLDWQLEDPAGRAAAEIRPIRDDIDVRVRALLTELTNQPADAPPRH